MPDGYAPVRSGEVAIWKWLGRAATGAGETGLPDSVRRLAAELENLPESEAQYLAAYAYLLGRVAHADLHVSEAERDEMVRLLGDRGGLDEEKARLVAGMAIEQATLFGATEDFLVAREFVRIATVEQRKQVLDCLYAVSAAHGMISAEEDNEIRQIAGELRLDSLDFLAVRMRYRDRLSLFQKGKTE